MELVGGRERDGDRKGERKKSKDVFGSHETVSTVKEEETVSTVKT